MKKLTRLLLIHWYTYDRELIEFENINFLTGKTAAGKSTIIDALQLVLLGDTNGNFFNKAANERSVRTLKSYLYGENGDDGETGFRYLRAATFTSYVVVEFEDTEKQTRFLLGLAADCYEDLHFDYKWFTVDKMGIPENCFTNPRTNTPYTIPQLKRYLRDSRKRFEIIDTNRRYRLPGMYDRWFHYQDLYRRRTIFYGTEYRSVSEKDAEHGVLPKGFRLFRKFDAVQAEQVCHEVNRQLEDAWGWLAKFEGERS